MDEIGRLRDWVKTYPGMPPVISVDYADAAPDTGSIESKGLREISRTEDVLGNVTVTRRIDFSLSFTFPKTGGEDQTALRNAEWLLDFQNWADLQSARGLVPAFGNRGKTIIRASGGSVKDSPDLGLGTYTVQLSVWHQIQYDAAIS
jgi:hypothetical protein